MLSNLPQTSLLHVSLGTLSHGLLPCDSSCAPSPSIQDSIVREDPQAPTGSVKEDPEVTHTMSLPGTLPGYTSMAALTFNWGAFDSSEFAGQLDTAFNEMVQWRKNCFRIPQGSAGKAFTSELARLFHAFATGSALESMALKAATVMPVLLLQKSNQE